MKRLICRKCGSSFFKYSKNESGFECNKCKSMIKIYKTKDNKVNYLSLLWRDISN